MSLAADSPAVLARFDRVCSLVAEQRRGLSLQDLTHAHSLARELEAETPDADRIAELAATLDLEETPCP